MRQKIYVTREIPRTTIEALQAEHDVTVNSEDRALSPDELRRNVAGCAAIVSLLTDRIDGALLDAAGPNCRIVANYAVGTNNFDVASATDRGIALTNTPGVLDDATATHTIALMLAMARRIPEAERFLREGRWDGWKPMFFIGADVDRKILGIAGAGRIGRNVARKARAFDMKIIYSDVARNRDIEDETGAEFVNKDDLISRSDFLTLHMPLLPETRHYISAHELGRMKPTAILINASRGPIVDEKALVEALRAHRIWGAALDVFEDEPALAPGLTDLPNLVIVPHIASATEETRLQMGAIVSRNVLAVLSGRAPDACINWEAVAPRFTE
ncbi:2-hydroxyacid dehydrogenase [Acidisoma cladoniae]|uniref:2-hydroxyacid dehydrogenase n=1 Tax=Acidisoma cladoniae TaxID=3040935 RepID=UPI00254E31B1|nr:D-glycerate dehydrogenase [Acidisoma sp. PAMC 29798]